MQLRSFTALAVVLLGIGSSLSQVNANSVATGLQVREEDGGSVIVQTVNGPLNQNSSLKRKWFVIDDADCPASLNRTGVITRFEAAEPIKHNFTIVGSVSPRQAISAVEVRYLLFDIWGQHIRTLSVTRLADSSTSIDLRDGVHWPTWESEAAQLITVVSFVTRVRTAEGTVWNYDSGRMLDQIHAMNLSLAENQLLPNEPRMIDVRALYESYANFQKK